MSETSKIAKAKSVLESVYDRAELVEKEAIPSMKFPIDEVLSNEEERKQRARKIHRATSLGNLEKHKVSIVFEDVDGLKKANTTIWAQTEKKIVLKGGNSIPVHRIWEVVI
ncbi:MAG: hypothetical protein HWE14_14295 [Flavobacteriia bacterium]|nr:hypothetical protein [Flavobacteriia bacterium]